MLANLGNAVIFPADHRCVGSDGLEHDACLFAPFNISEGVEGQEDDLRWSVVALLDVLDGQGRVPMLRP